MAKILILTPRFPYPIEAGDTLRIYHICKQLSKEHSLTLLSICDSKNKIRKNIDEKIFDKIEKVHHPKWRSFIWAVKAFISGGPLQVGYYKSKKFEKKVNELIPKHDMALAHLVRTGQYLEDKNDIVTVLEMTDALFINYGRVIKNNPWGWKNIVYKFEKPRMEKYERSTIQNFDMVSLVSDFDRKELLSSEKEAEKKVSVSVYTNGIDLSSRPYSHPDPNEPPVIAFIGNMRTVHNRDACQYFAEQVLPRVRERLPGTTFRIIGAAEERDVRTLAQYEGVDVTGWVDSIPKAAQGVLCGIGVMRMGAGLQNKILEYMALGVPVVANKRGLEGICAEPSHHFLLGSSPQEITDHIVRLAKDPEERQRLSHAGRRFVEKNHQWEKTLRPFVKDVNVLLEEKGNTE